jgi:ATP-dependent DNA helicase RecG
VSVLKKKWFVEWRYPNVYIGWDISKKIGNQTEYMKLKWFDDEYYAKTILDYLEKFKKAQRKEIKDLLWNKLPDILTDKQKEDKIRNLLNSKLVREDRIESVQWVTKATRDRLWILKN